MIEKLKTLFEIDDSFIVEYDFHYQCARCLKDIWDE